MATGTLTTQTIANTYKSLLKVGEGPNAVLHVTDHQLIEDGDGNNSVLSLAQDSVGITGSGKKLYFHDKGGEWISGDGTNLTITGGTEINLDCTTLDINANADISGTLTVGGTLVGGGVSIASGSITMSDDTFIGISNSDERIVFDAAGDISFQGCNVGMGTAAPENVLDVQGGKVYNYTTGPGNNTLASQLVIKDNATAYNSTPTAGIAFMGIYNSSGSDTTFGGITCEKAGVSNADPAGIMKFYTTPSTPAVAMTIDEDGNVGIGTIAPDALLEVKSATGANCTLEINTADTGDATSDAILQFAENGSTQFRIFNDGSETNEDGRLYVVDHDLNDGVFLLEDATEWAPNTSDARRKTDWRLFENALDKINTLETIGSFVRIDPNTQEIRYPDKRHVGLVAQEVQQILPDSILRGKSIEGDDTEYLTFCYDDVFVLAIKAIQELSAKVEALENA